MYLSWHACERGAEASVLPVSFSHSCMIYVLPGPASRSGTKVRKIITMKKNKIRTKEAELNFMWPVPASG